jgi:hypothetical protein
MQQSSTLNTFHGMFPVSTHREILLFNFSKYLPMGIGTFELITVLPMSDQPHLPEKTRFCVLCLMVTNETNSVPKRSLLWLRMRLYTVSFETFCYFYIYT